MLEEARYLSKVANDLMLLAKTGDDTQTRPSERLDLGDFAQQNVAMFGEIVE